VCCTELFPPFESGPEGWDGQKDTCYLGGDVLESLLILNSELVRLGFIKNLPTTISSILLRFD